MLTGSVAAAGYSSQQVETNLHVHTYFFSPLQQWTHPYTRVGNRPQGLADGPAQRGLCRGKAVPWQVWSIAFL